MSGVDTLQVAREEAGLRLDRWFRVHFPDVTYGYLQKLLRSGQVRVDSKRVQANARLEAGQQVRVPHMVRKPAAAKPSLQATGTPSSAPSCSRTSTCWC
jgi:23S rRNA pseudouridine955/2504/2580 synthase